MCLRALKATRRGEQAHLHKQESAGLTGYRVAVIEHLQKVVEEFVRRVCKQKGLPQSTIEIAGGKVFTFGSYALGVHGPSSDIDTLVVAPKYVSIDDFFATFPTTFKEMSRTEDIEEFVPVEEAHVPIIKMEYSGVSVDLIFASLPKMSSIPKDMATIEKKNLEGLSESATRSVNGTRVTKELLAAVPPGTAFRHALRAIKLWSNRTSLVPCFLRLLIHCRAWHLRGCLWLSGRSCMGNYGRPYLPTLPVC